MMKRLKLRTADSRPGFRVQNVSPEPSDDEQHPKFSFEFMVDEYSVKACDNRQRADLAMTLHQLGQRTWRDLKQAGRHKCGFEKINRQSIRTSIPTAVTEDVTIIAFRFSDMAPMVGFRRGATFFIVWLDYKFKLYDHS